MAEKTRILPETEKSPWDKLVQSVNEMKGNLVVYQQYQLVGNKLAKINVESVVHGLTTDIVDKVPVLKWFYVGGEPDVLVVTEYEMLGDVVISEKTNKITSFSLAWRKGKDKMMSRFTLLSG